MLSIGKLYDSSIEQYERKDNDKASSILFSIIDIKRILQRYKKWIRIKNKTQDEIFF